LELALLAKLKQLLILYSPKANQPFQSLTTNQMDILLITVGATVLGLILAFILSFFDEYEDDYDNSY